MKSLRSKLPLIGVTVALIIVLRAAVRQRRMLRLLGAFMFAYPGEDVVDFFSGITGGISDGIKDFVRGLLRAALQVVYDVFGWVFAAINSVIGAVQTVIDFAKSLVQHAIDGLTSAMNWLYTQAIHYADAIMHDLGNFLGGIIAGVQNALSASISWVWDNATAFARSLFDAVSGVIADVYNSVVGFAKWVGDMAQTFARNLFDAAMSVIDDVRSFLWDAILSVSNALWSALGTIKDAVLSIVGDLLGALHDALFAALDFVRDDILSQIKDLADYLWGDVQEIVDVIKKVIDWLIWLGELPFETAADLWSAIRSITPRHVMDEIGAASGRVAGPFLDDIKGKL